MGDTDASQNISLGFIAVLFIIFQIKLYYFYNLRRTKTTKTNDNNLAFRVMRAGVFGPASARYSCRLMMISWIWRGRVGDEI